MELLIRTSDNYIFVPHMRVLAQTTSKEPTRPLPQCLDILIGWARAELFTFPTGEKGAFSVALNTK